MLQSDGERCTHTGLKCDALLLTHRDRLKKHTASSWQQNRTEQVASIHHPFMFWFVSHNEDRRRKEGRWNTHRDCVAKPLAVFKFGSTEAESLKHDVDLHWLSVIFSLVFFFPLLLC